MIRIIIDFIMALVIIHGFILGAFCLAPKAVDWELDRHDRNIAALVKK